MTMQAEEDWRHGLSPELVASLEVVFSHLVADLRGEAEAPTVRQTIDSLTGVSQGVGKLTDLLNTLSPLAMAALFKAGFSNARIVIPSLSKSLEPLVDAASKAAMIVQSAHSSLHEEGQGRGSSMGRDKDLRAVALSFGTKELRPPARIPSHKFGARVIRELVTHSRKDIAMESKALGTLLGKIWACCETPVPSWAVTLKNRVGIIAHAEVWIARQSAIRERVSANNKVHSRDPSS